METSIQIAGVTVLAPVSVVTNLILSGQCALYFARLRTRRGDRGDFWALFFLAMSVATSAGALKHGLPHEHPSAGYEAILWICGLASAASVYCAQRATLVSFGLDRTSVWARLAALELVAYVGASAVEGPEMSLIVMNTAAGLIPVLVAESLSARRGNLSSAWVAAGLSVSIGSALVYVGGVSAGAWFNHIDLAHTLMGVSFLLMVRGGYREAPRVLSFPLLPVRLP